LPPRAAPQKRFGESRAGQAWPACRGARREYRKRAVSATPSDPLPAFLPCAGVYTSGADSQHTSLFDISGIKL